MECFKWPVLLIAACLSACTAMQSPYVAPADKARPLSDTAVFIASDHQGNLGETDNMALIVEVDGQHLHEPCLTVGCPKWVRVTPGTHVFRLRYRTEYVVYGQLEANVQLTIAEMKPRHTYLLRMTRSGNMVRPSYEDLGEDSGHGLILCGAFGDCKSTYRPRFD